MTGVRIQSEDLENRFAYHAPTELKKEQHEGIRDACLNLAEQVVATCPPGRETSLAVTAIEVAMMWANAAIARNP